MQVVCPACQLGFIPISIRQERPNNSDQVTCSQKYFIVAVYRSKERERAHT